MTMILACLLQCSKKCSSDLTEFGPKGQNLSFHGILGVLYLQDSITKLCELKRNFVNKDCLYLGQT